MKQIPSALQEVGITINRAIDRATETMKTENACRERCFAKNGPSQLNNAVVICCIFCCFFFRKGVHPKRGTSHGLCITLMHTTFFYGKSVVFFGKISRSCSILYSTMLMTDCSQEAFHLLTSCSDVHKLVQINFRCPTSILLKYTDLLNSLHCHLQRPCVSNLLGLMKHVITAQKFQTIRHLKDREMYQEDTFNMVSSFGHDVLR